MRDGRDRLRRRRRRSHRRQRRHRQQDRHVHRRGAGARAPRAVLRGRAGLDDQSGDARRRAHSRSKSATQREVTHLGAVAADARRREDLQSGVRRHAASATSPASSPSAASSRPPYTRVADDGRSSRAVRLAASLMNMLGIETSCDETAAAVIAETGDAGAAVGVRSNVVASQADIHREWGGVVPELASRQHVRDICGVVERARSRRPRLDEIDAIAVTQGPGLVGSLLVGVSFAKSAAADMAGWYECLATFHAHFQDRLGYTAELTAYHRISDAPRRRYSKSRLRQHHRGETAGRDRPNQPIQERRTARTPQRRRAARSKLGQEPAAPARPRWQPATERLALPDRDHAVALPPRCTGIPRTQTSRRQERREAIRCLKRLLARAVFNALKASPALT